MTTSRTAADLFERKWKQNNPRHNPPKGEGHYSAKISEAGAIEILNSKEKGVVLAARFGVSPTVVSHIRNRRIWKHLGAQ